MRSDSRARFRFGSFEVDLKERLLLRGGVKIRLQEQPFEVLLALLEARGELVTREQLRQRLWPSGTFVEFDDALNTAVKKIRVALCDDAAVPRYIETVPRRGYRFLATVETALTIGSPPAHNATDVQSPVMSAPRLRAIAAVSALLLLVLMYGASRIFRSSDDVIVAVLPFTTMSPSPGQDFRDIGFRRLLMEELQRKHPAHISFNSSLSSHIDYVLQAALYDDQRNVHVCVQLVRMVDQNRVWGEDFHRTFLDPKLQRELAAEIAQKLQPTLNLVSGASR